MFESYNLILETITKSRRYNQLVSGMETDISSLKNIGFISISFFGSTNVQVFLPCKL